MTAIRQDIVIEQGADFTQSFSIPANVGSLTGAAAAMQIRKEVDDPLALATLTTWGGTLLLDTAARTLKPIIDEVLSASLPVGACVYDTRLQTSDGTTSRTHEGFALVKAEVTTISFPSATPVGQFKFSLAANSGIFVGAF